MILTKFLFNHSKHNEHVCLIVAWDSWTDNSLMLFLHELSKQLATTDILFNLF